MRLDPWEPWRKDSPVPEIPGCDNYDPSPTGAAAMIVTCVHVDVKPEHVQEFIQATRINHQNSIKEPGNLRFDVLQSTLDPTKFMLYEAYESEERAGAHKQTEHYLAWRNAVEPWMARPRAGVSYAGIAP